MSMAVGRIELGIPKNQIPNRPSLGDPLIPNRSGFWRGAMNVYGPRETKPRLFIAYRFRAGWCWYWKKAGSTVCVELGPVVQCPTPGAAWRYAREMDAALEVF